ncbi:MAG: ABC transporter substrate-binding protein [Hydrogenibacillus sp.]|nr:ABC transporter substrate-binding protein [Hydrogenibacillus sp.]
MKRLRVRRFRTARFRVCSARLSARASAPVLALWGLFIASWLMGCASAVSNRAFEVGSGQAESAIRAVDATGTTVELERPPERIVTLLPSLTETVAALGGLSRLVGVTANDNYPPEVTKLPKVGDMTVDAERVLALRPDLVLAGRHHAEGVVPKLRAFGVPAFVVDDQAKSLEDVFASIGVVAELLGESARGKALAFDLKAKVERLKAEVAEIPAEARRSAFVALSPPPELYTAGGDTFIGAVLETAGVQNVAGKAGGWPLWSAEDVVAQDPAVILIVGPSDDATARQSWLSYPGLSALQAVREGRVAVVDADRLSRPGPRIVEALYEVAHAVYPEWIAVPRTP